MEILCGTSQQRMNTVYAKCLLVVVGSLVGTQEAFGQTCKLDLGNGGCAAPGTTCAIASTVKGVCEDVAVPRGEPRCACQENRVFNLTVSAFSPVAVSAGQSATATVSIAPARAKKSYQGDITLSCSQVTGSTSVSCAITPQIISFNSDGPTATATLTVSTDATTSPGSYAVRVSGVDTNGEGPAGGDPTLALAVITKGIQNVSLVREVSSSNIFLIVGDTKLLIDSPDEFQALGFNADKVRVVADGALNVFKQARLHAHPTTRPSDVFFDCPDLDWPNVWDGKHYGNCKPSGAIVRKDVLVAGWLNNQGDARVAGNGTGDSHGQPGVEDIHYDVTLDANFIDRVYGGGGLSSALSDAVWPGHPYPGTPPGPTPIPFATDPPLVSGGPRIVSYNSFILPCGLTNDVHGELNAWHKDTVGSFWHSHWQGHGPPPAGWTSQLPNAQDPNSWFPFNPLDPGNTGRNLQDGDYVVIRGTIWQENGHDGCTGDLWESVPAPGFAGFAEMHPPDWIVRVGGPNPNLRISTGRITLWSRSPTGTSIAGTMQVGGATQPITAPAVVTSPRALQVRSVKQMIDARFTNPRSVVSIQESQTVNSVNATAVVAPTGSQPARLKVAWLVGWRVVDDFDVPWVDDQTPPGAALAGDGEGWSWVSDNVFAGTVAHSSALSAGMHQHYFTGAGQSMAVNWMDTLFAMVFLDPDHPPDEVMLQWHTPTGWIRAFWGDDLIPWGTAGTSTRLHMGPLPPTGEWVRLEVNAQQLGIQTTNVNVDGLAFTLSGGRAIWDYAGRNKAGEILQ